MYRVLFREKLIPVERTNPGSWDSQKVCFSYAVSLHVELAVTVLLAEIALCFVASSCRDGIAYADESFSLSCVLHACNFVIGMGCAEIKSVETLTALPSLRSKDDKHELRFIEASCGPVGFMCDVLLIARHDI